MNEPRPMRPRRRILRWVLLALPCAVVLFVIVDFDWSPRNTHPPTTTVSHAGFSWTVTPDDYLSAKGLDVSSIPVSENAAFDYLAAGELLPADPKDRAERQLLDDELYYAMRHGWSDGCTLLGGYLSAADPAFEQALEGIAKLRVWWPIRMNDEARINSTYLGLSSTRKLCRALVARAWRALAGGDDDEAIACFLAPLQIGNHLLEGPSVVHCLAGKAVAEMGFDAVERWILTDPPADQLRDVLERVRAVEARRPGLAHTVNGERAMTLSYIDLFGKLTRDERESVNLLAIDGPLFGRSRTLRGIVKRRTQALFERIARLDGLSGRARHAALRDAERSVDEAWRNLWTSGTAGFARGALFAPESYSRIEMRYAALEIRLGLALYKAEHGRYPETLDEIKPYLGKVPPDPYTGDPFRYRLEGQEYVFYSLGKNLADDGGLDLRDDRTRVRGSSWGDVRVLLSGETGKYPGMDDFVFISDVVKGPPLDEYLLNKRRRPAEGWSTERSGPNK